MKAVWTIIQHLRRRIGTLILLLVFMTPGAVAQPPGNPTGNLPDTVPAALEDIRPDAFRDTARKSLQDTPRDMLPDSLRTTIPGSSRQSRINRENQMQTADTLPPATDRYAGRDSIPPDSVLTELPESGKIRRKKEKREEPKVAPEDGDHSPRKAIIYSAILPGLGQAYNKKYFKIPFVYGALAGAGYWIYYNNNEYQQALEQLEADPTDSRSEQLAKVWRRQLELSIIVSAGVYGLQIIDAYVDANLFYWDVDPDLTVRVSPAVGPVSLPSQMVFTYGLSCSFDFK